VTPVMFPPGSIEAADELGVRDGIPAGGGLRRREIHDQYRHRSSNQLVEDRGQLLRVIVGRPEFDHHVLAVDVAGLLQA
jgi:hypothetical protein